MPDELDLEKGDPSRVETGSRRTRVTGEASKADSGDKLDRELNSRLMGAFDQIVEWREARGDDELAIAISEDKGKMSKGLVSLTHVVTPLRKPLLIFLGFVEPVLAFGRVGRILTERFLERRQRRADEMAAAQAEWDAAQAAQQPGVPTWHPSETPAA